ncbi:unnamed protein product [Chrysoparadoxa australica]
MTRGKKGKVYAADAPLIEKENPGSDQTAPPPSTKISGDAAAPGLHRRKSGRSAKVGFDETELDHEGRGDEGEKKEAEVPAWVELLVDREDKVRLFVFFKVNFGERFVRLVNYICFITVFLCYVYAGRTVDGYLMNSAVERQLLQSKWVSNLDYYDISSAQDWFDWASNILLPVMYPETDYNGEPLSLEQQGFMGHEMGAVGYRVGTVRLRQLRVKADSCGIAARFADTLSRCYTSYSERAQDKAPWERFELEWASEAETHGAHYIGVTKDIYPGSGYVVELPNSRDAAQTVLDELYDKTFIDYQTRAIFVECTLYSPATKHFTMGMVVAEQSSSGQMRPSSFLRTYPLLSGLSVKEGNATRTEMIHFMFLIMLWVAVIVRTLQVSARLARHPGLISHFWVLLDVVNIMLFWAQFILGTVQASLLTKQMSQLGQREVFVNTFSAATAYEYSQSILSLNAVFTVLLAFQFVSFSFELSTFGEIWKRAWKDLGVICFLVSILIVGYALSCILLFGHATDSFRDVSESVATLAMVLLGEFDLASMERINSIIGPFIFITFVCVMVFVLLSMVFAVVAKAHVDTISEVHENYHDELAHDFYRAAGYVLRFIFKFGCVHRFYPDLEERSLAFLDTGMRKSGERAKQMKILLEEAEQMREKAHLEALEAQEKAKAETEQASLKAEKALEDAKIPVGNEWDQDGFGVVLPAKPRVALLQNILELEKKQRVLIQRLEDAIIAARTADLLAMPAPASTPEGRSRSPSSRSPRFSAGNAPRMKASASGATAAVVEAGAVEGVGSMASAPAAGAVEGVGSMASAPAAVGVGSTASAPAAVGGEGSLSTSPATGSSRSLTRR